MPQHQAVPERPTRRDLDGFGWQLSGPVSQLRRIGSDTWYELPADGSEFLIGRGAECGIQLGDRRGWVSRVHARLVRNGEGWTIRDLGSTNGTWIDGALRSESSIVPGTEVRIGAVALVAESPAFVSLRGVVTRMLGWTPQRRLDVDRALRHLRDAASLSSILVLTGEGDLIPIARRLHVETLGAAAPFVIAKRRRVSGRKLASAANGTLCFPSEARPDDIAALVSDRLRERLRVRLVWCNPSRLASPVGRLAQIAIPSLSNRATEITRLLDEVSAEAALGLGQAITGLRRKDVRALRSLTFDGIADLEIAVSRMVAIRTLGVTEGAARLGITHGALSRWAARRGFVT